MEDNSSAFCSIGVVSKVELFSLMTHFNIPKITLIEQTVSTWSSDVLMLL